MLKEVEMMKTKVGIVSCDEWIGRIKEDLFLQKQLLSNGIETELISWENQDVDYSEFKCLILRSVWGYQNKYLKFKEFDKDLQEEYFQTFSKILKNYKFNDDKKLKKKGINN